MLIRSTLFFSFMATNDKQTNVQLLRKFNNWEYSWWKSLNKRMPWFDSKGTHKKALLTTSTSPTYYPSGSIIWGGTDRHPADWIWDGGMRDPGVIWYWVNEDDCDQDRKPGGITWCICLFIYRENCLCSCISDALCLNNNPLSRIDDVTFTT